MNIRKDIATRLRPSLFDSECTPAENSAIMLACQHMEAGQGLGEALENACDRFCCEPNALVRQMTQTLWDKMEAGAL